MKRKMDNICHRTRRSYPDGSGKVGDFRPSGIVKTI
jgi:hypothetical protein